MQYYNLKIALKQGSTELLKHKLASRQQYQDRVNYFSFEMKKDIQLVEGKDTLSCKFFHFERAYDVSPYSVFLLGFALGQDNSNSEKTLLLLDKTFSKGLLKFTFKKNDLKNLPKLKTS